MNEISISLLDNSKTKDELNEGFKYIMNQIKKEWGYSDIEFHIEVTTANKDILVWDSKDGRLAPFGKDPDYEWEIIKKK